jgi:Bacterial archaeo-eukaryotic release factor family 7
MDTIDRTVFASLAAHHGRPAVSLYLPTHRSGVEKDQDPLRLKNLIAAAIASLVADGMRKPDAEALLGKASALLDDRSFWREMGDGLAIFAQAAETRVYRVDTALPEQFVVGSRFYLRPLALAYRGNEAFFAVAFDRNRARLFSGDRSGVTELPLDPAISSFAESTKYDEREESLQFTTHASPESTNAVGPPIGQFHGHGGENVDKGELQRFAAGLEKAVVTAIGPENTVPLVLLGVDYELVAYRTVNTYHALVADQVLGATDELTDKTVHAKALQALAARFADAVDTDLAELREKPSALVSTDPAEIVSAAASGRVKTLFFDEGSGPFGLFDRELFAVSSVCSAAPHYLRESADSESAAADCGWDLVDLAAAETVLHGGAIHAFDGEDSPVVGVAAVLRY